VTVLEAGLEALDPDFERDDLAALVYRRVTGRFRIDEWGLDRDLLAAVAPLARLRWAVRAEGDHHVPEIGPALLVHTRRLGISEPAALGMAVRHATGRPVRIAGVPNRGPLAWTGRRLGGVPSNVDDLRSLLRAGELVALALGREPLHPFHVPPVPIAPVEVALALGVPILPVAVLGVEPARRWVVRFGPPIVTRRRAATGDPAELADATRARLQHLLTHARRG
jgi:hypothetical protein